MDQLEADFCVIGAGFAGLAAAYKLKQAGRSVVVLEARERVGGRVYTEVLPDGTAINWGGTFIGAGHDRLYALCKEFDIAVYRQYTKGENLLFLDGKTIRYGAIPRLNPIALVDLALAVKRLDWMAASVPIDAPWDAEKAHEYDAQSLGGWIDSKWHVTTASAQKLLRASIGGIFFSDASEVSLLHALQIIHGLKSLEYIATEGEGGAQQDVAVGGMQAVADGIVKKLGDAVRLKAAVRQIKQDASSVEVIADTVTVRAARVINTAPPILAGRMAYDPPLPPLKAQLLDRSPAGQAIRCCAVYPEPFWRSNGLTGLGVDIDDAPQLSIDITPRDGKPGVLSAYLFGPPARHYATVSKDELRKAFLAGLVKRFGPQAAHPTYYADLDWAAQEWTRGDMFAHYAPGVLTGFGKALREPCGRIHWAGTETAAMWSGSMEGAICSGERAAAESLAL